MGYGRRIICPECNGEVHRLPLLTLRRRRGLTCPHCGTRVEVIVPALPYYLVNFGVSLFSSFGGMVFAFLWLGRKGAEAMWLALLLAALAAGSNVLLAQMAVVTTLAGERAARVR